MKKYTDTTPKKYSIARLRLDPNNKRIKLHGTGTSEKELINRLCSLGQSTTPHRIIKNILADSAFIHSFTPHVLKTGNYFTVVDGNCRVAALKMILDPNLIPKNRHGLKKDCAKLRGQIEEKIHCWRCVDKSCANRIVFRIHNEGNKDWESLAQYSGYYDNYVIDDLSAREIADYTGKNLGEIVKKINVWLLIEYLVEFIDGFRASSKNITSFERVTTEYPLFEQKLSIKCDKDGVYKLPNNDSLADAIHSIYELSAGIKGASREANKQQGKNELLNKALKNIDLNSKATPNSSQTFVHHAKTQKNNTASTASQGSSAPQQQAKQAPSPYSLLKPKKYVGSKASSIYKEHSQLTPLNNFPIASAALTRAYIETCLKHLAKATGAYGETQRQKNKLYSDSIYSTANKLSTKLKTSSLPYTADLCAGIEHAAKLTDDLNQVMHKDSVHSSRKNVEDAWRTMESVIKEIKPLLS